MKRREFITLLGGAAVAWPLAARAQQGERVRRVGVLFGFSDSDAMGDARAAAFRQGLEKVGWATPGARATRYCGVPLRA
jgi:putative ABC transport system substrate-binding protein